MQYQYKQLIHFTNAILAIILRQDKKTGTVIFVLRPGICIFVI